LQRKIIVALLSVTVALATTASAFAHDCFNPNKPAGAGVNYTIVGFDQNGPIFEQTGPGQGIGGFAAIAYPAKYGVSGVKTFMVNHDGVVYEADLGPQTAKVAEKVQRFDPGVGWSKVEQTK